MKAKRLMHFCMVALMASMMISCNGCKDDAYGPEAVTYSVSLCFIDSTGKDLVAGLKDNPDSCKLYICPEGIKYPEIYKENFSFDLSANGYWVMENSFFKGMDETPDRFTYQIVSHYLFGDDEAHLLAISWTIPDDMIHNRHFARCAHIKFDGSDVTDFSYEDTKFGEKTNYIKVILPQKSV